MTILLAAGAVALFSTLLFLRHAFACLKRGRVLRAGAHTLGCAACGGALAIAAILLVSYVGYERLTSEQVVAKLHFSRVAPFEFRARVAVEGQRDRFFLLTGNEWQIDARVVAFTPPATLLGLDPIYRLERLSGRYTDVNDEREGLRTVHALSAAPALDVWSIARKVPPLMPGVDAYYGTATYVPMADGAEFDVSLSRDALIARPVNPAAEAAVGNWR